MKKLSFIKALVVSFLVISVCPIYSALCHAGTISDNFDGTIINPRLWQPFAESQSVRVFQQGGELRIQIDGGSVHHGAGINSKFRLKGNFDATVDYRLISWPPANGVSLGFEGPSADSNQVFLIKRISFSADEPQSPQEVYSASFQNGEDWSGSMVPTTDSQGSLRLTRVGSVLTGYFKQNGVWQQIASHDYSASGYKEWVEITLWAIGPPPAGQNVDIAFDNFQVTYDQLNYISCQAPMNMLLLD
jgi:hypothetical protein